MASQFYLQRSTSLRRCAMRSLASFSRNRTSDAGKIGVISSTDFFNKIGHNRTHAVQHKNIGASVPCHIRLLNFSSQNLTESGPLRVQTFVPASPARIGSSLSASLKTCAPRSRSEQTLSQSSAPLRRMGQSNSQVRIVRSDQTLNMVVPS